MTRSPVTAPEHRSAIPEHGAGGPAAPSVSIIVPIYNEIDGVDRLVAEILDQDYEHIIEIWFADGGSDDGTSEALQRFAGADARIRVIRNSKRLPAAGLNLALQQASGDIVNRLDAHASYERDVVRKGVEALLATGAGGVGAIARPAPGRTLVARAIVAAHRSPIGVAVARFRREGAEGWTDSVWNGCYWRHVVNRVGLLREDIPRAEDNDFNARVRALGYGLYLSPAIKAWYLPRQTLLGLWRQYYANGAAVVEAARRSPDAISWRHFAPLMLLLAAIASGVVAVAWQTPLPFVLFLLAYLTIVASAAIIAARQERGLHLLLLPAALATLHFSYGCGSLWTVARKR